MPPVACMAFIKKGVYTCKNCVAGGSTVVICGRSVLLCLQLQGQLFVFVLQLASQHGNLLLLFAHANAHIYPIQEAHCWWAEGRCWDPHLLSITEELQSYGGVEHARGFWWRQKYALACLWLVGACHSKKGGK